MNRIVTFLALIVAFNASSQKLLPTPRNIQNTYDKGSRSITGALGKKYWQNTADYKIDIEFDPSTRLVSGTTVITYRNNSPDSLSEIWFKLCMNYYQKGAPRSFSVNSSDESEGLDIDQMLIDGREADPKKEP